MPFLHVGGDGAEQGYRIYYRMFPETMMNEAEVSWTKSSRRPRVIMLMGLGGNHLAWTPQIEHLAHFCDVCAVDNRGTGYSTAPSRKCRWTTRGMVADVTKVLDALEWDSGVHVVGISMGGMIAQEVALRVPDRIASLSLLATYSSAFGAMPTVSAVVDLGISTGMLSRDHKKMALSGMRVNFPEEWLMQTRTSSLHGGRVVENQRWLKKYNVLLNLSVPPELQKEGHAPPRPASSNTLIKQLAAVSTHRVGKMKFAELRSRGVPTLVLTGDEDALVRPANSEAIGRMLGVEVRRIPGCGHAMIHQCPSEVNMALQDTIRAGEMRSEPHMLSRL